MRSQVLSNPLIQVQRWEYPRLKCKKCKAKLIVVELPFFRCRCLKDGSGEISRRIKLYYRDNKCRKVEVFDETNRRFNAYYKDSLWILWELDYLGFEMDRDEYIWDLTKL